MKNRSLDLLETLALDYAAVGRKDEGKRFFALNLTQFIPALQNQAADPNACLESLDNYLESLPTPGP